MNHEEKEGCYSSYMIITMAFAHIGTLILFILDPDKASDIFKILLWADVLGIAAYLLLKLAAWLKK